MNIYKYNCSVKVTIKSQSPSFICDFIVTNIPITALSVSNVSVTFRYKLENESLVRLCLTFLPKVQIRSALKSSEI